MNLRRRRKRKTEQALDAAASVSKLWSEWQIGKRAAKGVAKVKDVRPPSKLKRVLSLKWLKLGGAAAVAGGTAAVVARKLKSDDPADYSGPPPSAAADAAVPSPESPPPLTVAPDPATQDRETEPASDASALRQNRPEAPAAPDDPELVGDDAAEAALDPEVENPGTGAAEVRATFAAAADDSAATADEAGDAAATPDDDDAATPAGDDAEAGDASVKP